MPGLDLPVAFRLLAPIVGAYDHGLREEVIDVDVIRVGMGIDQEADRLLRNPADFRENTLGHGSIGQAVDHDHIPLTDYDPGAAVQDLGLLQKGVDIFGEFAEFWHASPRWINLQYMPCAG